MEKEKVLIYRVKEDVDLNEFAKLDWHVIPGESISFIKIVEQPVDGDLYNLLLNNFYKNEKWKERVYKKYKKNIVEAIGLKYNKNGIIKYNEKLEMALVSWRLEFSPSENYWLGLKSADPFDRNYYYSKIILDKYCSEDIAKLKELGLIEEIEVEENV